LAECRCFVSIIWDNDFFIVNVSYHCRSHLTLKMSTMTLFEHLSPKMSTFQCQNVEKPLSPASELPRTRKLISEKWQKSLNNCTGNKLQSIYPTIGVYQHVRSWSRRDAVIIHRLRIGHTRLTHSYLLSGTDQPECLACHCPLTVEHILIECPALTSSRNKYFTASSMKDLFDNVGARNIINFIKQSHFYSTV